MISRISYFNIGMFLLIVTSYGGHWCLNDEKKCSPYLRFDVTKITVGGYIELKNLEKP